ncbi:MAG: FHA domain-containing protein [Candidatus Riflebacteria bacterium]|nr:FHA domain-containing protein [Candidatus Riflebacteria bacterium]
MDNFSTYEVHAKSCSRYSVISGLFTKAMFFAFLAVFMWHFPVQAATLNVPSQSEPGLLFVVETGFVPQDSGTARLVFDGKKIQFMGAVDPTPDVQVITDGIVEIQNPTGKTRTIGLKFLATKLSSETEIILKSTGSDLSGHIQFVAPEAKKSYHLHLLIGALLLAVIAAYFWRHQKQSVVLMSTRSLFLNYEELEKVRSNYFPEAQKGSAPITPQSQHDTSPPAATPTEESVTSAITGSDISEPGTKPAQTGAVTVHPEPRPEASTAPEVSSPHLNYPAPIGSETGSMASEATSLGKTGTPTKLAPTIPDVSGVPPLEPTSRTASVTPVKPAVTPVEPIAPIVSASPVVPPAPEAQPSSPVSQEKPVAEAAASKEKGHQEGKSVSRPTSISAKSEVAFSPGSSKTTPSPRALPADSSTAAGDTGEQATLINKSVHGVLGTSIHIVISDQSGRRFEGKAAEISIGRRSSNVVVLTASEVSRLHVTIALVIDSFIVTPLAQNNVTEVNGTKITKPQQIKSGDTLSLGGTPYKIEILERI